MSTEDYEWVLIVHQWMDGMKSNTSQASYFQNEMIFADFYSKSNKIGICKEERGE